ncbi:MAG: hypothetical protein WC404_07145 [Candidatus Omnitrophota bacterium]|jgi:hypothetical protein
MVYKAMPRQARSLRFARISVRFDKRNSHRKGEALSRFQDMIMANI